MHKIGAKHPVYGACTVLYCRMFRGDDLETIVEGMYGRVVAAPVSERRAVVAEAVTAVVGCLAERERLLMRDEVKMQWGFDPLGDDVPFVTITERNFKRWPLSWIESAHRIRQADRV
ncbi:MAG: hypothetical protein QNK37_35685 [Acidobacteriota bacterium]|nr:hypothetical protein [Acidobacteriota bacterium]